MRILEVCRGCFSEAESDGDLLRNVVLLGAESLNGRTYTQEAMERAIPLYERARVFLDHPKEDIFGVAPRSVRDMAGRVRNARHEGGKVKGDLALLSAHRDLVTALATENSGAGMSHVADGEARIDEDTGREIVTEISDVLSVDVVAEPATTLSFFESKGRVTMTEEKEGLDEMDEPMDDEEPEEEMDEPEEEPEEESLEERVSKLAAAVEKLLAAQKAESLKLHKRLRQMETALRESDGRPTSTSKPQTPGEVYGQPWDENAYEEQIAKQFG